MPPARIKDEEVDDRLALLPPLLGSGAPATSPNNQQLGVAAHPPSIRGTGEPLKSSATIRDGSLQDDGPVPGGKFLLSNEYSTIPAMEKQLLVMRSNIARKELSLVAVEAQHAQRLKKLRTALNNARQNMEAFEKNINRKKRRRDKAIARRSSGAALKPPTPARPTHVPTVPSQQAIISAHQQPQKPARPSQLEPEKPARPTRQTRQKPPIPAYLRSQKPAPMVNQEAQRRQGDKHWPLSHEVFPFLPLLPPRFGMVGLNSRLGPSLARRHWYSDLDRPKEDALGRQYRLRYSESPKVKPRVSDVNEEQAGQQVPPVKPKVNPWMKYAGPSPFASGVKASSNLRLVNDNAKLGYKFRSEVDVGAAMTSAKHPGVGRVKQGPNINDGAFTAWQIKRELSTDDEGPSSKRMRQ